MSILGTLAYTLTDMRYSLPQTAYLCSIAATGGLLAGSRMCSREFIPAGAELMADRQRRKQGLFKDCVSGLGWWDEASALVDDKRKRNGGVAKDDCRYGVDVISNKL